MTAEPGPGGHLGDDAQLDRDPLQIRGADGIAVHRRDREGRLRAPRGQILGEHAAKSVGERNLLGGQALDQSEDAEERFFDGNHRSASQLPDRPPDFFNSRRSVTVMPRSTPLHMS